MWVTMSAGVCEQQKRASLHVTNPFSLFLPPWLVLLLSEMLRIWCRALHMSHWLYHKSLALFILYTICIFMIWMFLMIWHLWFCSQEWRVLGWFVFLARLDSLGSFSRSVCTHDLCWTLEVTELPFHQSCFLQSCFLKISFLFLCSSCFCFLSVFLGSTLTIPSSSFLLWKSDINNLYL